MENTNNIKRKRLNKMHLLPKPLLKDINDAIDKGANKNDLVKFLDLNYKGPLEVKSPYITSRYIKEYKAKKQVPQETVAVSASATVAVVGEIVEQSPALTTAKVLNSKDWDWTNKKQILEELGNYAKDRIEKLHGDKDLTPGEESALVKYFSEVRSIIETLSKLSGELDSGGDKKVVINFINENMHVVLSTVYQAIKEVFGDDKMLIFKENLKQKFSEIREGVIPPNILNEEVKKIIEVKKVEEGRE